MHRSLATGGWQFPITWLPGVAATAAPRGIGKRAAKRRIGGSGNPVIVFNAGRLTGHKPIFDDVGASLE